MTETAEKPAKQPARDCYFRAPYAAMLAPFIRTEETRYYLNGICVTPHPDGGVILVATDGHRMGVAYDVEGHSNGKWICELPRVILDTIRRDAKKHLWSGRPPMRLRFAPAKPARKRSAR